MESVHEASESTQSDENSQKIDFNNTKWNCVTSQAFLIRYIQYLMITDKKNAAASAKTVDEFIQKEKHLLTKPSTSSDANQLKLDCELAGEDELTFIKKTKDWHTKLCKCSKCLKMYEDNNVEFLFGIKNIEWLPTEILLTIFTHLLPSNRRIASECCKRFLDIWLCDDFIDDRRLVFDKCVWDPEHEPLSIFLRSSRDYQHLVFGEVWMRKKLKFPEQFMETVTTVEFNQSFSYLFFDRSFLLQLPNLKNVKVEQQYFSNVPTTLDLLVISGSDLRIDDAPILQSYLNKTADTFRVELNLRIPSYTILEFTQSQLNKMQSVYLDLYDNNFKLPHFGNLKCLELNFCYDTDENDTKKLLESIEEQCPTLKDLSIVIGDRLPHKNWTFLKKLHAKHIPNEELSKLSIFENLKELTLERAYKCFFVHEAFLNENLKKLTLVGSPWNNLCVTCFHTMTKSFPKLENLTCNFKVKNDHLKELETNTPKLKCLSLHEMDPSVSFECLSNLTELTFSDMFLVVPQLIKTFPLMLHLRKLELGLLRIDFETVAMLEKMPALEDLRLTCNDIDDNPLSLFNAMSKSLKQLKEFWFICYKEPELNAEIYLKIVEVMVEHCNYLQHINFNEWTTGLIPNEVWEQVYQKHSSLRSINKNYWKLMKKRSKNDFF